MLKWPLYNYVGHKQVLKNIMFTMKTKIDKLIKSFKNPLKVHSFKLKSGF